MKKLFALFTFTFLLFTAYSQSVGIGTNAPNASAQLEIASTSKGLLIPRMTTAQRNAISSPVAGLMLYDTDLAAFYFYNGSSWNAVNSGGSNSWGANGNNIYNSNTGNVGVGLSSGIKEKLSVKGNLFITYVNPNDIANGGSRAVINLHGASVGGSRINFLNADSSVGAYINYYRLSGSLKDFSLNHGANTNQLTLNENGNVGIGTVATDKLDVNGNIRSRRNLQVDSSLNVKGSLNADGDIASAASISATAISATGTISGSTLITTGNLVVAGTGLVNGDFTSNSSITISNTTAILQLKNSSGDKGFVQLNGDNLRVGTFAANTAGKFVVRTGSADRLFVTNSGNVGIDVEDPIAKLQIMNGADVSISSPGYLMLGSVTGSNLIFDNNEIMARNNGATSSLILQNDGGTVRIGATAVPTGYKFAIDGKMICEELKVKLASSGWPDYVFADNYQLPALDDVQQFIKTNRHLPNIPSAADVELNGIEVGEMQKKMMEKIEQLTLYIIELKKELDILKQQ